MENIKEIYNWIIEHWAQICALAAALYTAFDLIVRFFIPTATADRWADEGGKIKKALSKIYYALESFHTFSR